MKNLILLCYTVFLISCSSETSNTPSSIGEESFNILLNLDKLSEKQYIEEFASTNELKTIAEKGNVSEKTRNLFTSMTKEVLNERILSNYKEIITEGEDYGIVWKDIKFKDFTYVDKETSKNFHEIKGKLYFEYKGKEYRVGTSSTPYKGGYILLDLRGVYN